MDNDTLRRGKPTVWAKYGEANAILVGDALQALAFQVAAKAPRNVPAVVAALGEKGVGVVAGQVEDVLRAGPDARAAIDVPFIYEHKTADLFIAAAVTGGFAGGGNEADVAALRRFALNLGLAFQYEDDILDGDSPFGPEETERRARAATDAALAALGELKGDTTALAEIARRLLGRKS